MIDKAISLYLDMLQTVAVPRFLISLDRPSVKPGAILSVPPEEAIQLIPPDPQWAKHLEAVREIVMYLLTRETGKSTDSWEVR